MFIFNFRCVLSLSDAADPCVVLASSVIIPVLFQVVYVRKPEETEVVVEMRVRLRECKHAVARNRVTTSPTVWSCGRPKEHNSIGRIAPFESCGPATEV